MSVSLYLGLPGDGKSMSGVRKVESVIAQGTRYVVTNLPLELGELQSYLITRYGRDFDCMQRIVLLKQEQVRKFWLVRGKGWRLLDISDESWGRNCFPSLQKVYRWAARQGEVKRRDLEGYTERELVESGEIESGSVEVGDLGELGLGAVYIIDECQNFWPARSFQTTPKGLPFYLTQHRHVGDDCVFITQKEGQVEKVVRNLVSEFWVFKNVGVRRRLGFRLPGVFGYSCFSESPSSVGALYQSMGTFRMDVEGLAKCYRTADGVGVGGPTMEADTKHKPSGISWKWGVALLLCLMVAGSLLPGGLAKVASRVFLGSGVVSSNKVAAVLDKVSGAGVSNTVTMSYPARDIVVVVTNVVVQRAVGLSRSNDVSLVSALKGERGWFVVLGDGRLLGPGEYWRAWESEDGRLSWVELEMGGQRARWKGIAATGSAAPTKEEPHSQRR